MKANNNKYKLWILTYKNATSSLEYVNVYENLNSIHDFLEILRLLCNFNAEEYFDCLRTLYEWGYCDVWDKNDYLYIKNVRMNEYLITHYKNWVNNLNKQDDYYKKIVRDYDNEYSPDIEEDWE